MIRLEMKYYNMTSIGKQQKYPHHHQTNDMTKRITKHITILHMKKYYLLTKVE